jgi:hypothetical protein
MSPGRPPAACEADQVEDDVSEVGMPGGPHECPGDNWARQSALKQSPLRLAVEEILIGQNRAAEIILKYHDAGVVDDHREQQNQ